MRKVLIWVGVGLVLAVIGLFFMPASIRSMVFGGLMGGASSAKVDAPSQPRPATPLPNFPWPPPQASAQMALPHALFANDPTQAVVADHLTSALSHAGYAEQSFYRVPDGFALVARLERMAPDGTPRADEYRFLPPSEREPFSLTKYVQQLFVAPEGYYRFIAFVVTGRPIVASGDKLSAERAGTLLQRGANRLPDEFRSVPFTSEDTVTALVYEYRKGAAQNDVSTLTPGRLSAETHLNKAGLMTTLRDGTGVAAPAAAPATSP